MKVKEIVTRVRSAIDELTANDSEFLQASSDEENLKAIIIDKIPYALTYIIENAPEEKIDSSMVTQLSAGSTAAVAGGMVSVQLPSEFLRLMSARLSSWSLSPIPVAEHSQQYLMQQDEYARGSWDRPVSAIRYKGSDRYLELYSAKDASDTVEVSYIAKPTIGDTSDGETEIGVPVRLEAAFIYQIAALTMVAFREQVAQQLFTVAQQYLFSTITNREQKE